MQYQEPDCSRAGMLEADLACLWPSSTPEDVIRWVTPLLLLLLSSG